MNTTGKKVLLACRVLETEISWLINKYKFAVDVEYLEQGLHDTPGILRDELKKSVYHIEQKYGADVEILCAYGLCGKAFTGVSPAVSTLVIPRIHDCIPLLLGYSQKEANLMPRDGSIYWLSPGWLIWSQIPYIEEREKRYADYVERFGEESADYILETENAWRQQYSRMCYINWPQFAGQYREQAEFVARDAGMELSEELGGESFLRQLLEGGLDGELFLRIHPGQTIDVGVDGLPEVVLI